MNYEEELVFPKVGRFMSQPSTSIQIKNIKRGEISFLRESGHTAHEKREANRPKSRQDVLSYLEASSVQFSLGDGGGFAARPVGIN